MEDYQQRRQRMAAQTQQAILNAAMELCRENSFDKVSVRDICRRAGITTGAFYHHFPSKEAMLEKGFSSLDEHIRQTLQRHGQQPPARRLALILTSYADFMEGLGWELTSRYYQQRLGSCAVSTLDPQRFTLHAIHACFQQAMQEGLIPPQPSAQWVADFVFRHFRGVVIDWVLNRGSYSLIEKLRQDYQFFEGAFRAGPALPQPGQAENG